jgi:signal transduction histidine kinase
MLSDVFHISEHTFRSQLGPVKVRFAVGSLFLLLAIVLLPLFDLQSIVPPVLIAFCIAFAVNSLYPVWIVSGRGLRYRVYLAIVVDLFLISIVLHYLGGIESSFSWMYAAVLIVIASTHGLRMGMYAAALSVLMYSALLIAEYTGAIHHVDRNILNPVYLHESPFYLYGKLASNGVLFFITAAISGLLSERLLRSRNELEETVTERTRALTASNEHLRQEFVERKRLEEESVRHTDVLDAINKVLRETLTCDTKEEVARTCLAVAEELTGSKLGFIGEADEDGRLDTVALSTQGCDNHEMPELRAVRMIGNHSLSAYWQKVMTEGCSQIVNDPVSHADRVGAPVNHPPVTPCLAVPLKREGKTIGMIAVAEKESGYDMSDQQAIEMLSVSFAEALNEKSTELELEQHREHLQELVEERTAKLNRTNEHLSREIAERKQAEEELRETNRKLKKLESLKEDLTNMVVHDMKHPVTNTMMALDMIGLDSEVTLTELQSQYLGMAKRNQFRLSEMITNLLEISRLEDGAPRTSKASLDVRSLINGVLERYAVIVKREQMGVSVSIEPAAEKIFSDQRLLEHILSNLLSNAIKHSYPKGKIFVRAGRDARDDTVSFSVEDFGEGIPKEYHQKIFDRFFQPGMRKLGHRSDTGLGLAFCRMAVEALGGRIWFESESGKGSCFTLSLPHVCEIR